MKPAVGQITRKTLDCERSIGMNPTAFQFVRFGVPVKMRFGVSLDVRLLIYFAS